MAKDFHEMTDEELAALPEWGPFDILEIDGQPRIVHDCYFVTGSSLSYVRDQDGNWYRREWPLVPTPPSFARH